MNIAKENISYIRSLGKETVFELLKKAQAEGDFLIQPRCGVGNHLEMLSLLQELEQGSHPDILTLTIDSYTRLCQFDEARRALEKNPRNLNGYPLVNHGWRRGRELNEVVRVPLEVRHGSPDARRLFDVAVASGITSFEGGGICYNLPYCKNFPLSRSLECWRYVDQQCGELAKENIIVDRELFGTLTGVLMPPSLCLAMTLLEALAAVREGVRCLSIAYCQGGNVVQDVAALRVIPLLARKYLPQDVFVFPVLHQFMGAFPPFRSDAESIIFLGALTAKKGKAVKVINKTYEEALGIPTTKANNDGIWTTRMAKSSLFDFIEISKESLEEEIDLILNEAQEIVEPVLQAPDLFSSICTAFEKGTLDIPFSASRQAKSEVLPVRDINGAIRYYRYGALPIQPQTEMKNKRIYRHDFFKKLSEDIFYLKNIGSKKKEEQHENIYS